ncbi:hypothetical protein [Beijerinckia sp. L45]|uniref:hypothetical protein n=1 Tax=Beijerinckia sp. L45 TaxID=1641855 RepID=UPI00131D3C93|nr:hypothetical protein [Beijerinckia sp. L45]
MLRLDIPITKVDAVQRLVYGVATAEIADRAGEICDYASTKPMYEKWSDAIATSSGGKSLGNLRAMHGAVAAGKVTALTFNDDAKQIEICAKVVDDAEWIKVAEGVYTGFSQGGAYARRWTDEKGAKRYTADPHEISLVDLPCLSEAKFEMIKADGSHEWRPFREPEQRREAGASNAPAAADGAVEKTGARNSATDQARIQKLHDTAVDLGAVCAAQKGQTVDLSKYLGAVETHFGALTKQVEAMADRFAKTLDDIAARLKTVEEQPQPLPFAMQGRPVSKQDDGAPADAGLDALLADPNTLSLLAIKLAQRQGATRR